MLIGYRTSVHDARRIYVPGILSGEKSGDMPIMQPTKFEPVINLNTAKMVGLEQGRRSCRLRGSKQQADPIQFTIAIFRLARADSSDAKC